MLGQLVIDHRSQLTANDISNYKYQGKVFFTKSQVCNQTKHLHCKAIIVDTSIEPVHCMCTWNDLATTLKSSP